MRSGDKIVGIENSNGSKSGKRNGGSTTENDIPLQMGLWYTSPCQRKYQNTKRETNSGTGKRATPRLSFITVMILLRITAKEFYDGHTKGKQDTKYIEW
jgi:hypothetical protein